MRILIATPLFPPDVGGPSYYSKALAEALQKQGHAVTVLPYNIEKKLPTGVRHAVYFLRVLFAALRNRVETTIALDTFSVGVPTVLAHRLLRRPVVIRVGGDFLWESYIARTLERITLSAFYTEPRAYSFKERVIFTWTKNALAHASKVIFSTEWQKEIWIEPYALQLECTTVIENFYPEKKESLDPVAKNFLWAGRNTFLKNVDTLEAAMYEAREERSDIFFERLEHVHRDELMEKIRACYAIILPSISEVSPNLVLEAIMYNKPFIVTQDCGFYAEMKGIGLFVDSRDKQKLAEAILFLADDIHYNIQRQKIIHYDRVHSYEDIAKEFVLVCAPLVKS